MLKQTNKQVSHPSSTKKCYRFLSVFLPPSQNSEKKFRTRYTQVSTLILERQHPPDIVSDVLRKVTNATRQHALTPKSSGTAEDRPLLAITCHPNNLAVKNIILNNFKIL